MSTTGETARIISGSRVVKSAMLIVFLLQLGCISVRQILTFCNASIAGFAVLRTACG